MPNSWFEKLFINEAKPALSRHSGSASVEPPPQVEADPLEQFFANNGPTEIVLPNITSIRSYALYYNTALTSVVMPNVTTIGSNAFYSCYKLVLTSLPNNLTTIGNNAFNSCRKLALTSLPAGITNIDSNAFIGCTGLTAMTFEGTPMIIASNAFSSCTNLTTINVPWAEGAVANAPWGATKATINYNYTGG